MKHTSIKIFCNSKFRVTKFHHNRNFYNWIAVPSMFGFSSKWVCLLGNHVVRYRGYGTLAW